MGIPWNNAAEYEALHDLVDGRIDPFGVSTQACPHGATECDNMIRVYGRYPDACPRFGGAKQTAHAGYTQILCKGDRYFEVAGEPLPTRHGTSWKKGK